MPFILTLVLAFAACVALREPIRRWPIAFYALAVAAVVTQLASASLGLPKPIDLALLVLVKRCYVAMALFTIVMFIGALPPGSRLSRWLRPIRAEVSIVACLLCIGHVIGYAASYVPRAIAGALASPTVAAGLLAALVLTMLLAVLGVTSAQRVKRAMGPTRWKRVQRLAYAFFVLACVHALLMLLPSALSGGIAAGEGALAYAAVLLAYLAARGARALADRRADDAARAGGDKPASDDSELRAA